MFTINRSEAHLDVSTYYDRNTRRFLRYSDGANTGALHRKLWPPEVHTKAEALLHVNSIIYRIFERELQGLPMHEKALGRGDEGAMRIIDLGCGVGGTVLWLAERLHADLVGVTISPVQAEIARESAAWRGLGKRCSFRVADFLDLPSLGHFHGAVAVESFAHARSAGGFFGQVSRILVRGGVLILMDDMKEEGAEHHGRASRWICRFEKGWHLYGLSTVPLICASAGRSGFTLVENRDLTPLIRVNPLLLFTLRPLAALPMPFYGYDTIRGSVALQHCIRRGYTRYRCMVFRKE